MCSRLRTTALSLAGLAFLVLGGASPAAAQMAGESPQWTVDAQGGLAVPTGDVSDLPIEDTGPAFSLGVGYHLSPRFVVKGQGGAEVFTGDFDGAPDVRFLHYNAGLEVELTPPGESPLDVLANVGGGGTTWDTDALAGPGGGPSEFTATYFTVNAGVKVGYAFASNASVFVGGEWYQQFTDEAETQRLVKVSPDLSEGFSSATSVPITLGLKFRL